jgi:lactoylglutathione lyase
MRYTRTGIILFVERYADCVAFYRDVLELPLAFEIDRPGSRLTGFDYSGAYLMIEEGGWAKDGGKSIAETQARLRFNVADLDAAIAELRAKGVALERADYDWGAVALFHDPDGNPCQLRGERGFGV